MSDEAFCVVCEKFFDDAFSMYFCSDQCSAIYMRDLDAYPSMCAEERRMLDNLHEISLILSQRNR